MLAIGLLVGLLGGCSTRAALPDVDVATAAAGATSVTVEGELTDGGWPEIAAFVEASAADGKATVVNVLASWCRPCEEELPLLLATAATTSDVRWIAVASQDRRKDAQPFLDRLGVTWPVVLDPTATVHEALDGIAMPTTAFFDSTGALVDIVIGQVRPERLAEALDRASR